MTTKLSKLYRIRVYGSESYADDIRELTPSQHRLICEIAESLNEFSAGDVYAPSMEVREV